MSRTARFSRSLASGYVLLGTNIVFTVASIPLALRYLSTEQFGIWAVVAQITSYMALFDLGMSGSAFRILVDHKDRQAPGSYETYYSTSAVIFTIQAGLIASVGALLGPLLSSLFAIPQEFRADFSKLIVLSSCLLAVSFAFKIIHTALQAHQRYDIINTVQSGQLVLNLVALWGSLKLGHGIYSGVIATAVCACVSYLAIYIGAKSTGCMVPLSEWRRPTRSSVKELLSFGTSTFLFSLGWQLVAASQILLVSRNLGLEAAGLWSIGTKAFNMCQQLVWRPLDYSSTFFSEMFVRQEFVVLRQRFQDIYSITLSMSAVAGAILVTCNGPLLQLWAHLAGGGGATGVRVDAWTSWHNVLSAMLLGCYTITRLLNTLPGVAKDLRGLQFVYFVEGAFLLLLGRYLVPALGYSGVLIAGILADILVAGTHGVFFTNRFFSIKTLEVARWTSASVRIALSIIPIGLLVMLITQHLPSIFQLMVRGVVISLAGVVLIWFFCLPGSLRVRIRSYLPRRVST